MSIQRKYLALDKAHEQLLPERNFLRSPWMRAEDLMNHDRFDVSKLGELPALQVLCSILFEVAFPDDVRGKHCRARAKHKVNEILTLDVELWWEDDFRTVETLLNQGRKSVEEIRAQFQKQSPLG